MSIEELINAKVFISVDELLLRAADNLSEIENALLVYLIQKSAGGVKDEPA